MTVDQLPNDQIAEAMIRDRHRLRRQRRQILDELHNGKDCSERILGWQETLQKSIDAKLERQKVLPKTELDTELPIAQRADEISTAIRENQVVVISGETGSGKSTQLPLICLQAGLGISGYIGHTQPRRIAARGVSSRIAEQTKTALGQQIGYKIRFGDKTSAKTLVKVMTDGILLAETGSDRFLSNYEVIIIDEAHERSLNIDFLMGYIKRLLPQRPELKVIITSATIDTQKFADHFTTDPENPVPIIDVKGRTYPVDIEYQPVGIDNDGNEIDQDVESATVAAVVDLAGRTRGDMLVFLPTEQSIRSLAKKLRSRGLPGDGSNKTEILPLYARLSNEQQNSIFKPGAARRIVLATNVAESSITVPRIRYVVDQGLARISRYAPRSKVQRLPIESISKASADQRAGRCGRIGPGICVRLFAEDDFNQRNRFTTPEIRRTNLASVILQTEALNLGAIDEFPFIESPNPESIRDGYKTLHEIGAVDAARRLTPLGRKLSRLPVDPRIGRMLFSASDFGCLSEILVIASALEIQDPRVRPVEHQQAADAAHSQFLDEDSDFVAILNLWRWLHDRRASLSKGQFRKACAQNFLSFMLVQQWMDVHRQLKSMALEQKMSLQSDLENYASIHQAIMTGILSGVGMLSERREYTGVGGIKFMLWPGSGVVKAGNTKKKVADDAPPHKRKPPQNKQALPKWVLVSEIVETASRFGRTVAVVDPAWIEPLAEHLVKRNHSDPHWSKKRQSAMAYEKVSLFGLPIVAKRPVRYGNIDPVVSRQLLIEQGLVAGEMNQNPKFLLHNQQVLEEIEKLAAKTRNRDWIVDSHVLQNWYDERLPAEAFDGGELFGMIKRDEKLDERLRFTADELMNDSDGLSSEEFPSEIQIGDLRLPVEYKFTPGAEDDGVTVRVPIEGVSQIHDNHLGWSVPGLLQPRIVALIRSLPKMIRRNLVPAPETADEIAERIEFGVGSFWDVMASEFSKVGGLPVTAEMFNRDKIDDSQKLNIQVCDENGEVIAQARNLSELRASLPEETHNAAVEIAKDDTWHKDGFTEWTWGELPKQIVMKRGVADVPLFPTIVPAGTNESPSINLRLFDHRERSHRLTRQGLAALFQIANRKPLRGQVNWFPELDRLAVIAARLLNSSKELRPALSRLVASVAFVDGRPIVRSAEEFAERQSKSAERIGIATQKLAPWLTKFLDGYQECCVQLETVPSRFGWVKHDVKRQFSHMFVDGFLSEVPWRWLQYYPRYVAAVVGRLERLTAGGADKDREFTDELANWYERFENRQLELKEQGAIDEELDYFGWMLQEYRVSLFAQKLGTSETVSAKRLEKQWKKI